MKTFLIKIHLFMHHTQVYYRISVQSSLTVLYQYSTVPVGYPSWLKLQIIIEIVRMKIAIYTYENHDKDARVYS